MFHGALDPFLQWELGRWGAYGLFFLLGSFVVATVSDVKHLSAQREFMDVWWAFAVAILVLDLDAEHWRPGVVFATKWCLVVGLALLVHRRVGVLLKLATADVAACTAAAALLSPLLVVLYYVALKAVSWPAAFVLARGRDVYPFMPVVTIATGGALALAVAQGVV